MLSEGKALDQEWEQIKEHSITIDRAVILVIGDIKDTCVYENFVLPLRSEST